MTAPSGTCRPHRRNAQHGHRTTLATCVNGLPHRDRPVGLQPQLLIHLIAPVLRSRAVRLEPNRLDAHVPVPAHRSVPATQHRCRWPCSPTWTQQGSGPPLAAICPTAPQSPDRDHVARPNTTEVRPHPAGRRGVRGEQRTPVVNSVGTAKAVCQRTAHIHTRRGCRECRPWRESSRRRRQDRHATRTA